MTTTLIFAISTFITGFTSLCVHAAFDGTFNVGTYNIRNFDKPGTYTNKNLLKKIIAESEPDLLSVQEIHNDSSFRSFVSKELTEYAVVLSRCGGGGSQKLGFIYKKSALRLLFVEEDSRLSSALDYRCGSLRPALKAGFKHKESGKTFAAVSVHLKAGGGSRNYERRSRQYRFVGDIMAELENKGYRDVLVMGDFNTTGFDLRDQDYANFQRLLKKSNSSTSADQIECTSYWGGRDYNDGIEEASTLDHVVYTDGFLGSFLPRARVGGHCKRARCEDVFEDVLGESYQSVSDHCPVTLSF